MTVDVADDEVASDVVDAIKRLIDQPTSDVVDEWAHDDALPGDSVTAFDLDVVSRRL